ncbi:MAG: sulfatase [Fidelibacterota bacterium]
MKSRRTFIKSLGIATLGVSLSGNLIKCNRNKIRQRPNILFIMSDDHAEKAISCYDDSLINTPNIDRIAGEGIRFNNSFVTNSICAPSRAVMLTGKYSHLNGLRDNRDPFDGSQQTFPKILQENGYETAIFGKWHLKTEPTGFDQWEVLIGQGEYYNPRFKTLSGEIKETGYTTDVITDKAINWLETRKSDKPFCMLVHHKAPHRNWMPPLEYLEKFKNKEFPIPKTLFDDYQTRRETAGHADMRIKDMWLTFDLKLNPKNYDKQTGTGGLKKVTEPRINYTKNLSPEQLKIWNNHYNKISEEFEKAKLDGKNLLEWKYQRYMQDYLACILSVDDNIGRLLDCLDEKGLDENTIVIYTSDQGFYLGEHGWYDKRFMYEESLSMPLVMRYPKEIKAGQVSDDIVLNLDFAPTFLNYANVQIPSDMQGESLRPVARGKTPSNWRKAMYYHYYEYPHGWHYVRKHYGIRTHRYKLIHFYGEKDIWEFYDLQEDPMEIVNNYENKKYASIIAELKSELTKLQQKYKDTDKSTF